MKGPMHYLRALRRRWDVARLAGPAVLRRFAREVPEAFIVQIGANDGQMMDPVFQLLRSNRWRGLVLEPVPHLFQTLQRNYAPMTPRVRAVNLAVATQSGELPFYHLVPRPGLPALPAWYEGLGSFRRDIVLKHADLIPQVERYLEEIRVPSLTWADLCAQNGVSQVDVLVTDTEGYDFEIIRQIDFRRWKPGLIVYEHHHFSPETRRACHALLKASGYRMFEELLDTWCLHTDMGPALQNGMDRAIRRSRFARAVP